MTLPVSPAPATERSRRTIRGNPDCPERQWIRWNDYGIGLFLQGDLKGASSAFQKVADLAPDKADGPLNLARCKLQEGDLPPRRPRSPSPRSAGPDWGKTQILRALVSKEEGRLDDALADLDRVLVKYPKDRFVLNQKARILYLAGRYADALPSIDRSSRSTARTSRRTTTRCSASRRSGAPRRPRPRRSGTASSRTTKSARASSRTTESRTRTTTGSRSRSTSTTRPTPAKAESAALDRRDRPEGLRVQGLCAEGEMVLKDDRPPGAPRPFARPEPPSKQAGERKGPACRSRPP